MSLYSQMYWSQYVPSTISTVNGDPMSVLSYSDSGRITDKVDVAARVL